MTMRIFGAILLSLFALTVFAQPKINSPYSRFGLGDPSPRYFAAQQGMGGQTAAYHDPYHLNIDNPASFAFLRSTAFEAGLFAKNSQYKASSGTQNSLTGNLAYLALGFTLKSPINELLDREKRKWKYGMGFSLTPEYTVGYTVTSRDTTPNIGDVTDAFQGNGGLNRFAWQGAARYKQTAFGASVGWLFGRTLFENTTIFHDTVPGGSNGTQRNLQNNFQDEYRASGLVWKLGVQHDFVLKYADDEKEVPKEWVTMGLTGSGNERINGVAEILRVRSRGKNLASGAFIDADTLLYDPSASKKITLPAGFSFGIQYVKVEKLRLGLQVGYDFWSNYKNELRPQRLRNVLNVSGGVEYIPESASYNRYLRRVRYRAGAYYRQDPRTVSGNLDDVGISLGLGFPLILPRQQASFINFAVEAGRLGANSPVEETYIRINLGFTLNDNSWFFKRRFE